MAVRALSREGHAAMSMRGESDRWIVIQKNTFTNWVNEQLRVHGTTSLVEELTDDFDDGIRLCALIEELQGKKVGKVIKKPLNHHQNLENVSLALTAIANDNVRLVNIGPEDIVNGSLKLILGLIWHLILRYQIGKTKFPAKKLMLAWLNAVIPDCHIKNFTTDWNDGTALHALIDYCQPGLSPQWHHLNKGNGLDNCKTAMNLAKQHFDIPLVVRPEDLSSPDLDDLSGMTYLSYFMKVDSPGYIQTRRIVRSLMKGRSFDNFTTDWADGTLLCTLVTNLGESASASSDPQTNLESGINAAKRLGVEPVLTAKEMCDPEVDHIGIMAYAAYFNNFKPVRTAAEKVVLDTQPKNCYIGLESNFCLRIEDDSVSPGDVRAECKGPDSNPPVYFTWNGRRAEGTFTPTEVGHHRMNVYCENSLIVGCPMSFKVLADRSQVTFSGVDSCSVGHITELTVDASRAGQGDIQCEARAPNGRIHNMAAVYRNGRYVMNFTPSEVGIYQVSVKYDGDHINGSPFNIQVNDPSRVRVYGLEGGTVGTGLRFNADTTEAGDGNLKVNVTYNGTVIPSYTRQERIGLYSIDFTPQGAGMYSVEVHFNETEVRGSPFQMEIVDAAKVTVYGDGLSLVPVNSTASFTVNTEGAAGRVDVEIIEPSGNKIPFNVVKDSGAQVIEYVPRDVGDHRISVQYNDSNVDGSPFIAKAYDTSAIIVSPISNTMVGKPVDFTIDVSRAGEGQLEIMINNGNLANTVAMERPSVYKVSFTPTNPGKQFVDINFNNETIRDAGQTEGSTLTCVAFDGAGVTVTGMEDFIPASHATSFNIRCETDDMSPEVEVFSPNGSSVPARIVSQMGGNFRVEWTPKEAGRHRVEVVFGGRQIDGSPFYVDVFDLLSIRVDNFRQTGMGEPAGFEIDLSEAGSLDPTVRISSPSGQTVPVSTSNEFGNRRGISYIPEEAGDHRIYITYAGFELPGCPFIQNIDEGGMPTAHGDGLYRGEEDKITTFYVDVGNRQGVLEIKCSGPNSIAKTNQEPSGDRHIVTYIPVEVGVFDLEIKWNGREIPGSPFHPRVTDPRKVKIYGGWQSYMDGQERVKLVVGEEKRLAFDISQAGPATMRAEVQGPTHSIRDYVDTQTAGQNIVCFTPEEQGNHYIHLFWGDLALPNSPFIGYATPVFTDAKVILTGRGLKEAKVREQAEFVIDGSQAGPGLPSVTLTGLKAEITNKVVAIGEGKFRCTYTPLVPGAYLLNITWNDRPLRGSPYKVNVVGSFYPKKVSVSGPGLRGGTVNSTMDVLIDVRNAGPGELTASCMGPSRVALCNLHDNNRDGTFTLTIQPKEPGRHVLQIKYGGEHVQGSPYILKVASRPDASKVRVTGPGVEHGILAHFKSTFIVETRGAGAGQLNVKIRGPKGGFLVEMNRDSQRDRTIECHYDPTETGDYEVHVKWSDDHVPGSPFMVKIFDTHQELESYLRNPQQRLPYQHDPYHHVREGSFPSSYSGAPRSINYAQWKAEI